MTDRPDLTLSALRVLANMNEQDAKSSVPALQKLLQHEDTTIAVNAAMILASLAPEMDQIAETLATQLAESKSVEDVRIDEVLRAIGKLGPKANVANPALITQLDGDDVDTAIETLGLIKAQEAKPRLTELLDTDHGPGAALALARIGDVSEETVLKFADMIGKTENEYLLMQAARELKQNATPVVRKLEQSLQDDYLAAQAAWQLSQFGKHAAPASDSLVKLIDSPDSQIQFAAISAIGQIATPESPIGVEKLMAILKNPEHDQWRQAARALSSMQVDDALPICIAALDDVDRFSDAAYAIGRYKEKGAPAVAKLNAAIDDENKRYSAIFALSQIGKPAEEAIPRIIHLLKSLQKEDDSHYYLVNAMGEFGPLANSAIPELQRVLKAKDGTVNPYVADAIWKISPARAKELGLEERVPDEE